MLVPVMSTRASACWRGCRRHAWCWHCTQRIQHSSRQPSPPLTSGCGQITRSSCGHGSTAYLFDLRVVGHCVHLRCISGVPPCRHRSPQRLSQSKDLAGDGWCVSSFSTLRPPESHPGNHPLCHQCIGKRTRGRYSRAKPVQHAVRTQCLSWSEVSLCSTGPASQCVQ